MSRSRALRWGLSAVAVINTVIGTWLVVAPHSFYSWFPGFGWHWISAMGPYDQHAFSDFGGALLGLAFVQWSAAASGEVRVCRAASGGALVQAGIHFLYHAVNFDMLPTAQAIANQVVLGGLVVLPATLLWLSFRLGTPERGFLAQGQVTG